MKARKMRLVVFGVSLALLGGLSVRPSHATSEGNSAPPPTNQNSNNNSQPQGQQSGCCGGGQASH